VIETGRERRDCGGYDRLEAYGWVARLPNPADGRSSLITLTAGEATLVAAAEQTFNDLLDELVGHAINADHVGAAGAALAALRQVLESARVGPCRIGHGPHQTSDLYCTCPGVRYPHGRE
jgi:hypothetical protein